jgi:hypothetical protein
MFESFAPVFKRVGHKLAAELKVKTFQIRAEICHGHIRLMYEA